MEKYYFGNTKYLIIVAWITHETMLLHRVVASLKRLLPHDATMLLHNAYANLT